MGKKRTKNTDEQLLKVQSNLKTAIKVIDHVLDGNNLGESIRTEQVNPVAFQKVLAAADNLILSEPRPQKSFEVEDPMDYLMTPIELLYALVFGTPPMDIGACTLPDDAEETYNYVVKDLTDVEKAVLEKHIFQRMTLKAIGEEWGLRITNVRYIETKALRKLRYPKRCEALRVGLRKYNEMVEQDRQMKEEKAQALKDAYQKEIEKIMTDENIIETTLLSESTDVLGLGVRIENLLWRHGIYLLKQIAGTPWKTMEKFSGLGDRSLAEIKTKWTEYLKENGLSEDAIYKLKAKWESESKREQSICY